MGELFDKAKGKIKEVEGQLTGDRAREAQGRADQAKGKVKEKFEDLKHGVRKAAEGAREGVEKK